MLNKVKIEKLADLAKLELSPSETEGFAGQISSVLQYVAKLQEIKVEDLSAEDPKSANLREDRVIGQSSADQEELIKAAPETQNNLVKTAGVFNRK